MVFVVFYAIEVLESVSPSKLQASQLLFVRRADRDFALQKRPVLLLYKHVV